jgi:hypothetical protein
MSTDQSKANWFIYQWRYSSPAITGVALGVTISFFHLSGSLVATEPPWYFDSIRAFQGMLLLMILLPAYAGLCVIQGQRKTVELAMKIDLMNETTLAASVMHLPLKPAIAAAVCGFLYAAVVNIPGHGLNFFEVDSIERSTIVGQIVIWVVMFVLLYFRLRIARAFNQASDAVEVDIFETDNLKPFAQIGLLDVLIISGAIILSTVQSLDFSFRPENYSKALFIAIPAVIFLATYPMYAIHRRMSAIAENELNSLNATIAAASKTLEHEAMEKLEVLLQRRERVQSLSTWPVDVHILQRFLFYTIIPPLAWVGAALVEFVITGFIQA